jgi:signal peptidase I
VNTPDGYLVTTEAQRANALQRANRMRSSRLRFFWDWLRSVTVAVLLFVIIRAFFVEAFKIPTGSMEGTLLVGDFLLVNKMVYGAEIPLTRKKLPAIHQPQRGDVIVFQWPVDPTKNFVKRILGLSGDTLAMRNGQLIRNGVPLRELYVVHTFAGEQPSEDEFRWQARFLARGNGLRGPGDAAQAEPSVAYHPSRDNWGPIVVPAGNYFVLGDNRDNSLDSRYWGFVADSLVRGQPLVVYYSYDPDSARRFDWLTRVRWKRFGELIH